MVDAVQVSITATASATKLALPSACRCCLTYVVDAAQTAIAGTIVATDLLHIPATG